MEEKNKSSNFFSPLRYPGGKNCIFPFVSNLFYENGLIGIDYAEPYAGGSGLALRLLFEEYVSNIYINDYDNAIFSFWVTILNRTNEFCEWIDSVPVDIKNWKKYREIQKSNFSDTLELAKSTSFLNRTNVSGVIKGGPIGGLDQKGKYKIDVRFNKSDLINRIQKIATLRNRIQVSNYDGIAFLNKLNNKNKEIFIYLDPPYVQKGADLYMNFYVEKDHKKLSQHVAKLKKRWMVSYDNSDFILNLYAENKKVLYNLSQAASNRIGQEVVIFSPHLLYESSISKLNSAKLITSDHHP